MRVRVSLCIFCSIMFVILHVTIFMTAFTSAEIIESLMTVRSKSMNGMIFEEHLFLLYIFTEIECASICMKHDTCAAFSTTPMDPNSKKITCRGHDETSVLQSPVVAVAGSKTYYRENNPANSAWLERPCTEDRDCPNTVSNVVCFATAGQCLCLPGYYYSHSRDDCVPDCPQHELQTTFLKYPKHALSRHYIPRSVFKGCISDEIGLASCLKYPDCRIFDLDHEDYDCHSSNFTALDLPENFVPKHKYDHYQRTCL